MRETLETRRLAVLILTRNRLPMIRRLLSAQTFWDGLNWWQGQRSPGLGNIASMVRVAGDIAHTARVVVLDQAGTDGTQGYLAELSAYHQRDGLLPIDVITSDKNLGCAGGRNALITHAKLVMSDDIAVFLDDDIVPTSHQWLERLVAPILAVNADISGVEGRTVDKQGWTHPATEQPDYVSGGWMAVRNSIFMTGQRFDERFNPNYYEDVDFCRNAAERGGRIAAVGDIGLLHTPDHGTTETLNGAMSRKKFVEKWGGWLQGKQA